MDLQFIDKKPCSIYAFWASTENSFEVVEANTEMVIWEFGVCANYKKKVH